MHTSALPPPAGRHLQLNFDRSIRPGYLPAPPWDFQSDDELGALDAPDVMPAGAVYRGVSNNLVLQRVQHRQTW